MNLTSKKCLGCGSTSFTQASNHKLLRLSEKIFTIGTLVDFTVCSSCGEVLSVKILHPGK